MPSTATMWGPCGLISWVTLPRIWTLPLLRQIAECISAQCHQSPIRQQRQFVMGTTFSRKLYAWQLFFTITPLTWLILKDKLKKILVTKCPFHPPRQTRIPLVLPGRGWCVGGSFSQPYDWQKKGKGKPQEWLKIRKAKQKRWDN